MKEALSAYLVEINRSGDHGSAVMSAAECLADPWDVVTKAGLLARCRPAVAKNDLALRDDLRVMSPGFAQAFAIPQGAAYPQLDRSNRRLQGAFDTPKLLARQVVESALAAGDNEVQVGLDPACGTGAFLLAMAERG
ncbi:MAG: hypothetical protein HN348_33350, partial [Proteobacteria bacterium]|nr:hypothetical protein [Pseudomonadota bacterium]